MAGCLEAGRFPSNGNEQGRSVLHKHRYAVVMLAWHRAPSHNARAPAPLPHQPG